MRKTVTDILAVLFVIVALGVFLCYLCDSFFPPVFSAPDDVARKPLAIADEVDALADMKRIPAPALFLPCEIINARDGDSVSVTVSMTVDVRLLDCWAPELKDQGGIESRDHLRSLAPEGARGVLCVPLHDTLSKSFSFGRILGRIRLPNGDLSDRQVQAGHATKTKTPDK